MNGSVLNLRDLRPQTITDDDKKVSPVGEDMLVEAKFIHE